MVSKRKLLQPIAPASIQTVTAEQLVAKLNDQWDKFESLTATVDIEASHLKTKEGVATDYPSFRSNILVRKPEMLHFLGKLPVVQTSMFDLASDGTRFTMVVPHNNKAYVGLNAKPGKSAVWYENLRPGFLFSAMVVEGLKKNEQYSVIADTTTEEDPSNKHLMLHPDYLLNVVRPKPGSPELYPVRVVRFHREDLRPYEQDLYDDQGNLQTQVLYGPYRDFGGTQYPSKITLRRPQEEYQLVMSVERVTANPVLEDDQFHVKIPEGYTVQNLE
jgi:hypothetical protein